MAMQLRNQLLYLNIVFSLILLCTGLPPVHAENDARAVSKHDQTGSIKRLISEAPSLSKLSKNGCVLPGEVLNLKGENLIGLSDYHLVLRAQREFVALKQLSISKQHILVKVPHDTALKRGQSYPILLLASNGANVSKKVGMSLRICPSITTKSLLPEHEAHETGEILILANSGLTDQIIKQGTKLGYLLLRRYQLNSVNQTLMVLGGSDKKLARAIKQLRATFANAKIDFNHHYYASANTLSLQPADKSSQQPDIGCAKGKSHVSVGMLDGEVDMTHPALVAKNIKSQNFLHSAQLADKQHATEIAVLLVGKHAELDIYGLIPFVDLKVAEVMRQDKQNTLANAESITRALDWFINENIDVLNVSLTGHHANQVSDFMFAESIHQDIIVFAEAGNDGRKLKSTFPAALPGVIAITALNAEGETIAKANQGSYIDFAAPVASRTTTSTSKQQHLAATSFAVPHAVSIAASYLALQSNMSSESLYKTMRLNAVDLGSQGYDKRYGWGQLRVNQSLCQP